MNDKLEDGTSVPVQLERERVLGEMPNASTERQPLRQLVVRTGLRAGGGFVHPKGPIGPGG